MKYKNIYNPYTTDCRKFHFEDFLKIIYSVIIILAFLSNSAIAAAASSDDEKAAAFQHFQDSLLYSAPGSRSEGIRDKLQHMHYMYYSAWIVTAHRSGEYHIDSPEGKSGRALHSSLHASLEGLASELILEHNIADALMLPTLIDGIFIRRRFVSRGYVNVAYAVDGVMEHMRTFVAKSMGAYFEEQMHLGNYAGAYKIITAYEKTPAEQRVVIEAITDWSSSIQTAAIGKIESLVCDSVALRELPARATAKTAEVEGIINSFPDGPLKALLLSERGRIITREQASASMVDSAKLNKEKELRANLADARAMAAKAASDLEAAKIEIEAYRAEVRARGRCSSTSLSRTGAGARSSRSKTPRRVKFEAPTA